MLPTPDKLSVKEIVSFSFRSYKKVFLPILCLSLSISILQLLAIGVECSLTKWGISINPVFNYLFLLLVVCISIVLSCWGICIVYNAMILGAEGEGI